MTTGVDEEEKRPSQIRPHHCCRPNFLVSVGEGLGEHGVHSSPSSTESGLYRHSWDGVLLVSQNFHGRIVGEVIVSQSELGNDIRVLLAFAVDFWNSKSLSLSQFSDGA